MKAALIILTFLVSMPSFAKQALTCRGDLYLFNEQFAIMPLNDPKKKKSIQISEGKCRKLKIAFDRFKGVVSVDPWNGIRWSKMAFAYNRKVKFKMKSDGRTNFKVSVNYKGEERKIDCRKKQEFSFL